MQPTSAAYRNRSEAYEEPRRTSTMELLAVNYIKKSSIIDVRLSSKWVSGDARETSAKYQKILLKEINFVCAGYRSLILLKLDFTFSKDFTRLQITTTSKAYLKPWQTSNMEFLAIIFTLPWKIIKGGWGRWVKFYFLIFSQPYLLITTPPN